MEAVLPPRGVSQPTGDLHAGEANQSYLIVKMLQTSSHQPISLSSNSIQELHSSHIIQTLQKSCSGMKIQVQRTNYRL